MKKLFFKFIFLLFVVFAVVYSCIDEDLAQPNQQSSNQQNNINESRLIKFDEIKDQNLIDEIQKNEKILNQLLINIPQLFNLSQKEGVESSFILEKNAILSIQSAKSSPTYTLQVRLITPNITINEVLYNLLISSDFNGKYDGQLVKYETEFKENSTSTNQNNDLKVYTFDLRELEKESILQEVKKEITSKTKNAKSTSGRYFCTPCYQTFFWKSNPSTNTNNSGYNGGGSGQGVTNDILIQAGYGYLVGQYTIGVPPPFKCRSEGGVDCAKQYEEYLKNLPKSNYIYTTPVKTYSISDVTIPNNSTSGSSPLNWTIGYFMPNLYDIIKEYYEKVYVPQGNLYTSSTYLTQEEHNRKQNNISSFFTYLYNLQKNDVKQFNYLKDNKHVLKAIFNFSDNITYSNMMLRHQLLNYFLTLSTEQNKFLEKNTVIFNEIFEYLRVN